MRNGSLGNAVLQGIGKVNVPVVNAFFALLVQSVTLVLLLVFTDLSNLALCIVTIIYSLLMCVLNSMSLKKYITTVTNYKKVYVLPIASAVIMGGIAYLTYFLANSAVYLVCYLLKASLVASDMDVFDFMYTNYFVNL